MKKNKVAKRHKDYFLFGDDTLLIIDCYYISFDCSNCDSNITIYIKKGKKTPTNIICEKCGCLTKTSDRSYISL